MLDAAEHKSFKHRFAAIRTLEKDALLDHDQALQLTLKDAGANAFLATEINHVSDVVNDLVSGYERESRFQQFTALRPLNSQAHQWAAV